jgi:secreted trypsin-like serine protease
VFLKLIFTVFSCLVLLAACNSKMQSAINSNEKSADAIINGNIVSVRDSSAGRSVVMIEFLDGARKIISLCSGTLIGPHAVLTAGHCFDSNVVPGTVYYNIVFQNVYQFDYNTGRKIQSVYRIGTNFYRHEMYNTQPQSLPGGMKEALYDHDLAVVKFRGEIPAGFGIVTLDSDRGANYQNQNIVVFGYGVYDSSQLGAYGVLRRGTLMVDDNYNLFPDRYHTTMGTSQQVCNGDSGGPQLIQKEGVLKQIGINSTSGSVMETVSRIRRCAGPSQATKVAMFYDWIMNKIKKF